MLSTAHAIRQSQQMYEQEMRGKKIHVFVDLSNVAIGAQVGPDGKRDVSVRINVSDLVDCVYQGRDVKGRYLVTSVAKSLDGNRQPTFIRDWQKVGFDVRVQDRRGGSEQMLDEVLIVSMQATIMKFGASKLGTGPDQKQHTLVLLSGDGNTNHDHHSFAETIESALADGMFVEVWAWRNSVSRVYTQGFMKHYGGSFTVRYLDDYRFGTVTSAALMFTGTFHGALCLTTSLRDRITRKSNAGSAVADDDDGDWMVCPITCEVIIDAAATKVRHLSFALPAVMCGLLHELTTPSHTVCPQAILRKTKPRELGSGARVVSPHAHGVLAAGSFSTTVCSRTRSHMVIVRHAPRTSYRARRKCARVCKSTLSGPPTARPLLQRERTQVLPLRMLARALVIPSTSLWRKFEFSSGPVVQLLNKLGRKLARKFM